MSIFPKGRSRSRAGSAAALSALCCLLPLAQAAKSSVTAPPQPVTGPGGSTSLYSGIVRYGPFEGIKNNAESVFFIYQPSNANVASLPVVLFAHGMLLNSEGSPTGDQPSNYIGWVGHMVEMGYTVVFPTTFDSGEPSTWLPTLTSDWGVAIGLLTAKYNGMVPPTTDSNGLQTVCAGHSYGAYDCFTLVQSLYLTPQANIPVPRAIAAMNPALGSAARKLNLTSMPPTLSVVEVKSDEEVANQLQTADQLWQFLEVQIPSSQRDYLMLVTDSHGTPAQLGNHCWPLTNGFEDDTTIDDRDFNISYKLSVGLFNCVLSGTDCNYGLGHGSADQINMGVWSDGTTVAPLLWNPPFYGQ